MWMRAWAIAAVAMVLLSGPAHARGTKLMFVVRPEGPGTALAAKRFALALGRATNESSRHDWVDLAVVAGGPDMQRAQRDLESANRKARRGREALYRLEVRGAAQLFRDAIATYKENAAHLTDVNELGEALMYLGAILLHAKKTSAAKKALAEAITMMPDLEPDAQVFNPPMRRVFDEVKAKVLTARGSLAVSSSPAGALALIDGRPVGLTPITVSDLHEGRHVVRVIDDGLVSWGDVVDVVADAETQAKAQLVAPARLPDLPGRIGDAYRAAARGGNAALHVADLGRPLEVDQILLVRVRPGDDATVVDAALYGVAQKVRLARAKREFTTTRDLSTHARALLDELKPPRLVFLVGALRVPGGRAELGRNAKRAVTEIINGLGGTVSFLSTPLTPQCLNNPTCVAEAAAGLAADGVLELELKGSAKLRVRARCLAGHSGQSLWADQTSVSADNLGDLHAIVARAVDAAWEARVAAGGSRDAPDEVDIVTWDPSTEPAEEPDVLHAPVPEKADPANWSRVFGWSAVGVGGAAGIGGLALALERNTILADPDSSGDDKASARRIGRFAVGAAIAGAAITALGGWLTWDSYAE